MKCLVNWIQLRIRVCSRNTQPNLNSELNYFPVLTNLSEPGWEARGGHISGIRITETMCAKLWTLNATYCVAWNNIDPSYLACRRLLVAICQYYSTVTPSWPLPFRMTKISAWPKRRCFSFSIVGLIRKPDAYSKLDSLRASRRGRYPLIFSGWVRYPLDSKKFWCGRQKCLGGEYISPHIYIYIFI